MCAVQISEDTIYGVPQSDGYLVVVGDRAGVFDIYDMELLAHMVLQRETWLMRISFNFVHLIRSVMNTCSQKN